MKKQRLSTISGQGKSSGGHAEAAVLVQAEAGCGETFHEQMRAAVRRALQAMMEEEISALCGARHHPAPGAEHRRAGSEPGHVHFEGRREAMLRPRVRQLARGGQPEREAALTIWEAASDVRQHSELFAAMQDAGASARGVARATTTASKSEVCRQWAARSLKELERLRGADLGRGPEAAGGAQSGPPWLALMLDGIFLSEEICVIVAVGIDGSGRKQMLDFEVAASENKEAAAALCTRLCDRGFGPGAGQRLLAVLDGAKALRSAVVHTWPGALVQECIVHMERRLCGRLPRRQRAEAVRLIARLRHASGAKAGRAAFDELERFVRQHSSEAADCLAESRPSLLALHSIDCPVELHKSLLNTNIIENVMRNWRAHAGHVKRWRGRGDMVSRWMASGLAWAEAGFRQINGCAHLPALAQKLRIAQPAATSA